MEQMLNMALETTEEMVFDRGYTALSDVNSMDVFARINERKYLTPSGKLAITVIVESTSQIKNYSDCIGDPAYETIICIYMGNITIAHKAIEKNSYYKIEILPVSFLIKNVSKHVLQPIVTKDDTGFKHRGKLPKISFYDPIVRYYKFNHKDILKITSKINGTIHYRIVV
ncbi:hypothetical protein [Dasineura jujubifolia toursvirus 2a]|nr:hypothetical protein [Dasineura jujubifolia toursvirus 2a]